VIGNKRYLGNRTTEEVIKELIGAKNNKCTEVTITGGEPTIRPDIFEIVSYAKALGFVIQMQTNGRAFFYDDFTKSMINCGVDDFVVAIHGHNSKVHDGITRAPGSFKQTLKGIKNLKKYDAFVYTNTVVTKLNYKILPQLVNLLSKLKVNHIQFAFVHPGGNAYKYYEKVVPNVSEIIKFVHKGIDIANKNGIVITVEAIPFCWMQGYEKHIVELFIPSVELRDMDKFTPNFRLVRKTEGKAKSLECIECRFDSICEGFWREYTEKKGLSEFRPIKGKPIDVGKFKKCW
jgi:MoaA/NifB/PqqE/SkfB family radical SAM enzyme